MMSEGWCVMSKEAFIPVERARAVKLDDQCDRVAGVRLYTSMLAREWLLQVRCVVENVNGSPGKMHVAAGACLSLDDMKKLRDALDEHIVEAETLLGSPRPEET